MLKYKFVIPGTEEEIEVVAFSEANKMAASARVEETSKLENFKTKISELDAEVNRLKVFETKATENENKISEMSNEASSSKKYVNIFKMFEGKIPFDHLDDYVHIPLFKDLDISNEDSVAKAKEIFQSKYPSYFEEKTNVSGNTTRTAGEIINPTNGTGSGSAGSGNTLNVTDLFGKSKSEINQLWDTVKEK